MNINFNNYKNKAIDWFHEHKREIKVGAYCLAIGVSYGFVKGVILTSGLESNHIQTILSEITNRMNGEDIEDAIFTMSPEELLCFVDPDHLERLAEACKDRLKANE